MTMRLKYDMFKERLAHKIAFMLPDRVVMYCIQRAFVYATTGDYSKTDCNKLTAIGLANRWGGRIK